MGNGMGMVSTDSNQGERDGTGGIGYWCGKSTGLVTCHWVAGCERHCLNKLLCTFPCQYLSARILIFKVQLLSTFEWVIIFWPAQTATGKSKSYYLYVLCTSQVVSLFCSIHTLFLYLHLRVFVFCQEGLSNSCWTGISSTGERVHLHSCYWTNSDYVTPVIWIC